MYKCITSESIMRKTDGAIIPVDLANSDYTEFLRWIADGNTAEPADQPTQEEMVSLAMLGMKSKRLEIFRGLDTLQVDALTAGNQSNALAIMQAKADLMALNNIDLSGYQTAEAMEQAIQQAYWAIVDQAPQAVQDAFNALVPR